MQKKFNGTTRLLLKAKNKTVQIAKKLKSYYICKTSPPLRWASVTLSNNKFLTNFVELVTDMGQLSRYRRCSATSRRPHRHDGEGKAQPREPSPAHAWRQGLHRRQAHLEERLQNTRKGRAEDSSQKLGWARRNQERNHTNHEGSSYQVEAAADWSIHTRG